MGKRIYCSCHAIWLLCKTSIAMNRPFIHLRSLQMWPCVNGIHKWRPQNCSFVFNNLNLKQKFFEFVCADAASDDD